MLDIPPHEHFPKLVRNLSEQFGIRTVPGGLSLPGSRGLIPAMSQIEGVDIPEEEVPIKFQAVLPHEGGGLTELYAGSGDYHTDRPNDMDRSFRTLTNWVQEDDAGLGQEAGVPPSELEAWRDSENFGRDHVPTRGQFDPQSVEEAVASVSDDWQRQGPVHPWVARYNAARVKDWSEMSENGRYLIGHVPWSANPVQPYYRLDPTTGEVVD